MKSLRVLKVGDRLLTCGATAGYDPAEDIRFIWPFELQVSGSNGWTRQDLHTLLDMVQAGKLKVVQEDAVPLERAAEALGRIEGRNVFGKMMVQP
ncbi:MAG: zinc-binding dehydrogenase [Janthinobacterium lividum]